MIKFVEQNQVDEPIAMIDIIMPIDIEDKKGILKEDLVAKIQLNDENIEWDLAKKLVRFGRNRSYKTSYSQKVTHKGKKKMKHREFQFSKTIDEKSYKFNLKDALMLHFKVSSSR